MWRPGGPKPAAAHRSVKGGKKSKKNTYTSGSEKESKAAGRNVEGGGHGKGNNGKERKRKALSKNLMGLKFMSRKREAADAARMAAKRRREEAAAQWVAPAPLETIDASGTSNETKTASAVIRRSNVTAVPLEHIINSRRSFGKHPNKATEDNHKFLQRQLNTHQREEEAERCSRRRGDGRILQRSTSKSGRQRGERTGSGSGGILGKRGSRSNQFRRKKKSRGSRHNALR